MRARCVVTALLLLGGCMELRPQEGYVCVPADMQLNCSTTMPPLPDMAVVPPKCAAAANLAGTNLLCVDFDKVTGLSDPALAGWNFNANLAGCWQISAGALQVQNFSAFVGACGVTLPPLDFKLAANQSYQRATIALVHKVDLSDPDQQAQVFVDLDAPARLLHQTTSRPGLPTLTTTTLTVNKADLPTALMSVYKFYLKASAVSANARQGWQIQSIAVNATP